MVVILSLFLSYLCKTDVLPTADISPGLQATLIDEYSNEKAPSDGEVYRKVRQYEYEANPYFKKRWMARLSSNKAKRLRQLESHDDVCAAFDALLQIPALIVHGMQLGSLPDVLASNCDEVCILIFITFSHLTPIHIGNSSRSHPLAGILVLPDAEQSRKATENRRPYNRDSTASGAWCICEGRDDC